jgi:hypothetical protein
VGSIFVVYCIFMGKKLESFGEYMRCIVVFGTGGVHVCYISLCDYLSKDNLVLYRSIKDENWRNFVLKQLYHAEEQTSLCVQVGRQELV